MNIPAFTFLNQFAKSHSTVLLGAKTFEVLPFHELAQDFEIKEHLYNRSSADATIQTVTANLESIFNNLFPSNILINLGETELSCLDETKIDELSEQYRWLLYKIHTILPEAKIIVTSTPVNSEITKIFNNHIKAIAKELGCEYIALPDRSEETNDSEYYLSVFKKIKNVFYRRDLSNTDLAKEAILRFS